MREFYLYYKVVLKLFRIVQLALFSPSCFFFCLPDQNIKIMNIFRHQINIKVYTLRNENMIFCILNNVKSQITIHLGVLLLKTFFSRLQVIRGKTRFNTSKDFIKEDKRLGV
jgi:hypothetical protein